MRCAVPLGPWGDLLMVPTHTLIESRRNLLGLAEVEFAGYEPNRVMSIDMCVLIIENGTLGPLYLHVCLLMD